MDNNDVSRRSFLGTVGTVASGAFAFTIVPRHVLGGPGYVAPSDRVNVAIVGAGGQGMSNARALVAGGQNVAVLVDVDYGFVDRQVANSTRPRPNAPNAPNPQQANVGAQLADQYAKATRYADFRVMLEKEKGIDGVVIATPDHGHAVQAIAAMQAGKAVYVQKPLTWSVAEARALAATAKRTGVVTQMGNQGHSFDGTRQMVEWIRAGLIGPVREVHIWTNRPIWPQGIPRPTTEALYTPPRGPVTAGGDGGVRAAAGGGPNGTPNGPTAPGGAPAIDWTARDMQRTFATLMASGLTAPPPGLNWDLFIGPSPMVPYHPIYHPFNWRGWTDWGMGALGDMGAHLVDQPFWALDLDLPTSIEATSSPFGLDVDASPATYPQAMTVHYEFAARGKMPPVKMSWYDGGLMPPRPEHLPDDVVLDRSGGGYFVGTKGIILYATYGNNPRLYPASLTEQAAKIPHSVKRITVSHEINWANAIMGKAEPSSDLAYASRLTETMLLGIVALRTGQGVKIAYDAANMRVTNRDDANQYLQREYRAGWTL
ncbi:oxidoreductase domain protein [Gemmatirosa kalamazoonensis]|uniref:Oxidoreductase domain protein n=1 Tax=Gemmatirosa kalamazoonensis TaxID=861299 RepID=W0RLV1_9BACT|nr:Gfo/Idh/MocA family oxidoreductase [Gemmatirosa kalamazoonensis]AHG92064.1 oxidoreductase domain protein [Gemmatirosa kalamazoonensis]